MSANQEILSGDQSHRALREVGQNTSSVNVALYQSRIYERVNSATSARGLRVRRFVCRKIIESFRMRTNTDLEAMTRTTQEPWPSASCHRGWQASHGHGEPTLTRVSSTSQSWAHGACGAEACKYCQITTRTHVPCVTALHQTTVLGHLHLLLSCSAFGAGWVCTNKLE